MSYDVYVECGHCGQGPGHGENYTSNMASAWNIAGAPLCDWDGRRAGDCVAELRAAIAVLVGERERFAQYEPENGWGSVSGAREFLQRILARCKEHPDFVVRVSR
jgi:hypothetical protein